MSDVCPSDSLCVCISLLRWRRGPGWNLIEGVVPVSLIPLWLWLKLLVGCLSLCSGGPYTYSLRAAMAATFREATIEQTTTISVGNLTKPAPVCSLQRSGSIYIHISHRDDWLCTAIGGVSRGRSPLKGMTCLADVRNKAVAAGAEQHDPMAELEAQGSALADPASDLETPKNKSRKSRAQKDPHGEEITVAVNVADVLPDLRVFEESEREKVRRGELTVLACDTCQEADEIGRAHV